MPPVSSTHTDLFSVYSLTASTPFSRPRPLALKPPNGTDGATTRYALIHTVPARIFAATRCARCTSLVHTAPARPYGVSLASFSASSSSVNVTAESTGPNTSSRNTVSVGFTPMSTVGLTK